MPCKMGNCLSLISPKMRADPGLGGAGSGVVDSLHRYQSPLTDLSDICHLHRDSISRCDVTNHLGSAGVVQDHLISSQNLRIKQNLSNNTNSLELKRFEVKSFQLLDSAESFATSSSAEQDESPVSCQDRLPTKLDLPQVIKNSTKGPPLSGSSRFKSLLDEFNRDDEKIGMASRTPVVLSKREDGECSHKSNTVIGSSSMIHSTRHTPHKRSSSCGQGLHGVTMTAATSAASTAASGTRSGSFSYRRSTGEGSHGKTRGGGSGYSNGYPSDRDFHEMVNKAYKDGRTLLHNAAHQGDMKTAAWLIRCGAKVNARDHTRRTPLHEVADMGHISMARLLLEHGAKVNARDKWKHTPLHQAVAWKQARMVRLLLLQHDARATGGNLLQDAINMDPKEDVIVKLIQRGADVNATDVTGQTPIHMAIKRGRANIVWLLVEAGADINKVSRGMIEGNHDAVLKNAQRQLAPLGLERCLQDGWSPLRVAQKYRHFDLVVWLVNYGANIVLCDGTGRFPHHKATLQRNCPSLHHIVAHPDCPLDIRDIDGNTALRLNFEGHAKSMVDANPQCGCCSNQPGTTPAPSCDEYANTTILLLQHGADVTDLYIHGYDLLYHLSSSKFSYDLRVLQAVLNSGNDLSEVLSSAQSCLNALQRQQRLDMYEYLAYFVTSPRTMRDQCRLSIRSHLRRCRRGHSIWTAVTSLPLPHAVMDFLLLQNLQGATLTRHFTATTGCPIPRPIGIDLFDDLDRKSKGHVLPWTDGGIGI